MRWLRESGFFQDFFLSEIEFSYLAWEVVKSEFCFILQTTSKPNIESELLWHLNLHVRDENRLFTPINSNFKRHFAKRELI